MLNIRHGLLKTDHVLSSIRFKNVLVTKLRNFSINHGTTSFQTSKELCRSSNWNNKSMGISHSKLEGKMLVLAISKLLLTSLILLEARDLFTCVLGRCPNVLLNVECTVAVSFLEQTNPSVATELMLRFSESLWECQRSCEFFNWTGTPGVCIDWTRSSRKFSFPPSV